MILSKVCNAKVHRNGIGKTPYSFIKTFQIWQEQ